MTTILVYVVLVLTSVLVGISFYQGARKGAQDDMFEKDIEALAEKNDVNGIKDAIIKKEFPELNNVVDSKVATPSRNSVAIKQMQIDHDVESPAISVVKAYNRDKTAAVVEKPSFMSRTKAFLTKDRISSSPTGSI